MPVVPEDPAEPDVPLDPSIPLSPVLANVINRFVSLSIELIEFVISDELTTKYPAGALIELIVNKRKSPGIPRFEILK